MIRLVCHPSSSSRFRFDPSCNHTSNALKRSTYIIIIPLISRVLFFLSLSAVRTFFSALFSLSLVPPSLCSLSLSRCAVLLSSINITLKILPIRYGNQKALEHIQRRLTLLFLRLRVRTNRTPYHVRCCRCRCTCRRSWRVISTSSFTIYSSVSS